MRIASQARDQCIRNVCVGPNADLDDVGKIGGMRQRFEPHCEWACGPLLVIGSVVQACSCSDVILHGFPQKTSRAWMRTEALRPTTRPMAAASRVAVLIAQSCWFGKSYVILCEFYPMAPRTRREPPMIIRFDGVGASLRPRTARLRTLGDKSSHLNSVSIKPPAHPTQRIFKTAVTCFCLPHKAHNENNHNPP